MDGENQGQIDSHDRERIKNEVSIIFMNEAFMGSGGCVCLPTLHPKSLLYWLLGIEGAGMAKTINFRLSTIIGKINVVGD